uniref:Putative transketolase domain containing protein n=1 Tax=viral metagenome TaxID=1070528 RepID=A0A6H1ZED2_9ZZZZ
MNYREEALTARKTVMDMIFYTQKSHIGSNLSCIDILTVLFNTADITRSLSENEDRIIAGKGWIAASFYYFLAQKGVIDKKDLDRFCQDGEKEYIGLLEPSVNGVHCATGSIGMGLPFGTGMALAKKIKGNRGRVFVLEGDGGMQCGMTWEAVMIAAQNKLDNLVLIIDRNGLQAMGESKDIINGDDLDKKLSAFGWETEVINGHDFSEITKALQIKPKRRPVAIIADTIKGKGVSFMENQVKYHYCPPDAQQYEQAMKEFNE